MPTLSWPAKLCPRGVEWRIRRSGVVFRSPFTGSTQSVSFVGEYWEVGIQLNGEGRLLRRAGELDALLDQLAGAAAKVSIWNWARPEPRGTLRGSPTLAVVTVRGDSSLVLSATNGETLEAGDMIGLDGDVFRVKTRCVASAGTITVPVTNKVRRVIAETTPAVWHRPTITAVMAESSAGVGYVPGQRLPAELMLVEDYAL